MRVSDAATLFVVLPIPKSLPHQRSSVDAATIALVILPIAKLFLIIAAIVSARHIVCLSIAPRNDGGVSRIARDCVKEASERRLQMTKVEKNTNAVANIDSTSLADSLADVH